LLEAIGFDPTPVDEIIRRSELTTAAVSSMLLIMELDGRVASHIPAAATAAADNRPQQGLE
jgi:DNA processing protein